MRRSLEILKELWELDGDDQLALKQRGGENSKGVRTVIQ